MRKKYWLAIITIFNLQFSDAQDLGPIRKGIHIAIQTDGSFYQTTETQPTKWNVGGHAGFFLKIPFDNRVFFVPQAELNYRRFQQKQKSSGELFLINEGQLRLSPTLQIDLKQNGNTTIYFQFGPSIGFGLAGQQTTITNTGAEEKGKLRYGFQAYGRYDASAHAIIGLEKVRGFRFAAEYVYGLGNMINTELGPRLKYRTIALKVGYLLPRRKS